MDEKDVAARASGEGGLDDAVDSGEAAGAANVWIEVSVPMLLSDCTGGRTRFPLAARTLTEAMSRLVATYPLLRRHLYTERGEVRRHVLIFWNDDNIEWLNSYDVPLREGDRLRVLQAVSGG